MNRRGFLGLMLGGVATAAAASAWPHRVFSFPAEIKIPPASEIVTIGQLGGYFDYANFSRWGPSDAEMARDAQFVESVREASRKMAEYIARQITEHALCEMRFPIGLELPRKGLFADAAGA